MRTAADALLLETVECLRDLLGDLIDLQPPDTQERIAELQVRLLEAVRAFDVMKSVEDSRS